MTWLLTLYRRWLDRHDPAWQATGVRYTTPRHYDEAKAVKSAAKAKKHTASGRKFQRPEKPQPARVVPLRRRA